MNAPKLGCMLCVSFPPLSSPSRDSRLYACFVSLHFPASLLLLVVSHHFRNHCYIGQPEILHQKGGQGGIRQHMRCYPAIVRPCRTGEPERPCNELMNNPKPVSSSSKVHSCLLSNWLLVGDWAHSTGESSESKLLATFRHLLSTRGKRTQDQQ